MPRKTPPKVPSEAPIEMHMWGYEMIEKTAMPCATSARVLVPKHWIGKRVRIIRVDQ